MTLISTPTIRRRDWAEADHEQPPNAVECPRGVVALLARVYRNRSGSYTAGSTVFRLASGEIIETDVPLLFLLMAAYRNHRAQTAAQLWFDFDEYADSES